MKQQNSIFRQILLINLGLLFAAVLVHFTGCSKKQASNQQEMWIYTSLYKDTIADLEPRLAQAFPNVKFNFYQAGSEEIAAKVNAEMLSGGTKADILISSDRFWYEELAQKELLQPYNSPAAEKVPAELRHPKYMYTTLSIPVMVIGYNSEAVPTAQAPKSFQELGEEKWKGKVSSGSPLASGTNFTTVAVLQNKYGWEYIQKLKKNQMIAEGGNSAVIRRIQTKERPVGLVLLENILRFKDDDNRMKVVYPEDGVVFQSNVIAIVKKPDANFAVAEKFVDWMYQKEGQQAMVRSYMYSPLENVAPPEGAPPLAKLREKAFMWSQDFIANVVQERVRIKEKFAEIMFE